MILASGAFSRLRIFDIWRKFASDGKRIATFLRFVKFSFSIGRAVKFGPKATQSWFGLRFIVRKFCASVAGEYKI